MSSSVATARIRLTTNEDVIRKLRRLAQNNINGTALFRKNGQGQEYFSAMFDGMSIPFYIGQEREIPLAWAESLAMTVMPMDEPCKNCGTEVSLKRKEVSRGTLQGGGECPRCKGSGLRDSNIERPLFKILSQTDASVYDPNNYQSAPPLVTDEATKALTA